MPSGGDEPRDQYNSVGGSRTTPLEITTAMSCEESIWMLKIFLPASAAIFDFILSQMMLMIRFTIVFDRNVMREPRPPAWWPVFPPAIV